MVFDQTSALQAACDTSIARITVCVSSIARSGGITQVAAVRTAVILV